MLNSQRYVIVIFIWLCCLPAAMLAQPPQPSEAAAVESNGADVESRESIVLSRR